MTVVLLTISLCSGKDDVVLPRVKITSMHVESKIVARLARVLVTTYVRNDEGISHETQFTFQLPDTAFISNFTMTVGNKIIPGIVKEKGYASNIYEDSKKQGVSAAIIDFTTQNPNREMKIFTVSVNNAAKSKAVFKLQYHELLTRKFGKYKQRISFQPNQIVSDLVFKAKIYEQEGINAFWYTLPNSNASESSSTDLTAVKASDHSRELVFKPTAQYQATDDPIKGISGEVILMYDVLHENSGGVILQEDDYFVHYLAPSGFSVLEKNIVFVIDISGSMSGLKMEQTRNAMLTILEQLNSGDYFNILLFDNKLKEWFSEPLPATRINIKKARKFVIDTVHAKGGTGINSALLRSIDLLTMTQNLGGTRGNIIVFLTDGRATSGITNTKTIRRGVTNRNNHRFSIFSLGFGFDVDMPFLKALSWENGGFARRIYEEGDASKQLESFYYELQDPTLIDVDIEYQTNAVEFTSLTRTSFPQYFQGSEIIIAGKLNEHAPLQWTAKVKGRGSKNSLDTETSPTPFQVRADSDTTIMEKVWAYMKINDLLKNTAITDDVETKAILKKRTLALSLKYNFVTPLTSMVVSESLQTPRFSVDDQQTWSDTKKSYPQTRSDTKKSYTKQYSFTSGGRGHKHLNSFTSGGRGHTQLNSFTSGGRGHEHLNSFTSGGRGHKQLNSFTSGGRGHTQLNSFTSGGRGHKHLNSFSSGNVSLQMQPAYKNVSVQPRHDHSLIKSKGTAQNSNTSNINRTELMTTFMWIAFTIMMII